MQPRPKNRAAGAGTPTARSIEPSFTGTGSAPIIAQTPRLHNLQRFADAGAHFTRVPSRSKKPKDTAWQLRRFGLDAARDHADKGESIGVLLGAPSGGIVCLDADTHYTELRLSYPRLANTWTVTRSDAPDRGKVFVRVTDGIPPTRSYKKNGREIQLLSTGAQAVIHGLHEDGRAFYEAHTDGPILEVTLSQLAAFWRVWTGQELLPEGPRPAPRRRRAHRPGDGLVARVKAAWPTALDVFEHHGLANEAVKEGRSQWRLRHNGGLICGDGDDAWRWYNHTAGVGGDAIDAWGWLTYKERWPTKHTDGKNRWNVHNSHMFVATLRAMAQAAGISLGEEQEEKVDLPDFDRLKAWAASWDGWPTRTRETDRTCYVELLYLAEEKGTDTLDIGCRELAERVGCGHNTANKALTRLAELGLIEVAEQADAYHAATWRICSQIGHTTQAEGVCPVSLHILAGRDEFMHGARLRPEYATPGDDSGSVGPTGRSFLAALLAENDLDIGAIAERTGMHRVTASKKTRTLAALGLLRLSKVGRSVIVHLKGHWRTLLDSLRRRMTTCGRGLRRQIDHVTHRAGRCVWLLEHLPDRLREYRARIMATWERSTVLLALLEEELQALRREVPGAA